MEITYRIERTEQGASLVEYALLIGLIAVVCIVSLAFFGKSMSQNYLRNASSVSAAGS